MIIWAQRLFSYYIMMSFLCTAYAIYLETGIQEWHQEWGSLLALLVWIPCHVFYATLPRFKVGLRCVLQLNHLRVD